MRPTTKFLAQPIILLGFDVRDSTPTVPLKSPKMCICIQADTTRCEMKPLQGCSYITTNVEALKVEALKNYVW